MLQLEAIQRQAPPALQPAVAEAQETARGGVEDMREIARGLRPQALDELGLRSALVSLAAQVTDRSGTRVRATLPEELPRLAPEQDLALYRVAQESLTNVVRHADAERVELSLRSTGDGVTLTVRDDGVGLPDRADQHANGIRGMR